MKNYKETNTVSRRRFIGSALGISAGLAVVGHPIYGAPAILKKIGTTGSKMNGVQIGVITYSFRSMPDQSAEATLQYITDCGISAVELMGDPAEKFAGVPEQKLDRGAYWSLMRKAKNGGLSESEKKEVDEMQKAMQAHGQEVAAWRAKADIGKFEELKKMYAAKGVSIYAFKPNAFGERNTDAEINYGMRAAKALGASHITLEFPGNLKQTKRLSDIAAKYDMYVAYHGHTQQTPTMWDEALAQSKYNAMNLDAGHYVAAGNPSVIDLINAKHDRIKSMHVKDRQTKEHGQGNLPWGQGDTPIVEILQTMRDKKYKFPASIELEYQIPADSDAVTEVKKCVAYCRKALG